MNWGQTGMVMNIFIWRLVQCTCFALYVLWNKWLTVLVPLGFFFFPYSVDIFGMKNVFVQKYTYESENMIQNNHQPVCWDC